MNTTFLKTTFSLNNLYLAHTQLVIIEFVLAERLQKVIHDIISPTQTSYIKKRFIGDNVRLTTDLIDYSEMYNIPCILLSLDFEKAFDSINWEFMFESL